MNRSTVATFIIYLSTETKDSSLTSYRLLNWTRCNWIYRALSAPFCGGTEMKEEMVEQGIVLKEEDEETMISKEVGKVIIPGK